MICRYLEKCKLFWMIGVNVDGGEGSEERVVGLGVIYEEFCRLYLKVLFFFFRVIRIYENILRRENYWIFFFELLFWFSVEDG